MLAVMARAMKLIAVSLGLELAFAASAAAMPPMGPGPVTIPVRLTLGAGVADRNISGSNSAALPLELTLTPLQLMTTSGGLVFSRGGVDHAYLEVGFYLVASVAAGAGYGAYDSAEGRKQGGALHLFLGFPIPLRDVASELFDAKWFPYLEPYYRPSWGPWPGTVHEAGIMMKLGYTLRRGKVGG